jgi:hypothetical protein
MLDRTGKQEAKTAEQAIKRPQADDPSAALLCA